MHVTLEREMWENNIDHRNNDILSFLYCSMNSSVLQKRTNWSAEETLAAVQLAIDSHDRYLVSTPVNRECHN